MTRNYLKNTISHQPNQIDIWCALLSDEKLLTWAASRLKLLSPEEIEKASRFRFPRDRLRYWVTRVITRVVLAQYVNRQPHELVFVANAYGRPELLCSQEDTENFVFNISHADDLIVIAVSTSKMALGIDVENGHLPPSLSTTSYPLFFTGREIDFMDQLDVPDKPRYFWQLWTLKESFAKAIGKGMSMPFAQLGFQIFDYHEILVDLQHFPTLHAIEWRFSQLRYQTYVIALCHTGDNPESVFYRWFELPSLFSRDQV